MKTYQLIPDGEAPAIKCLVCGAVSYNQGDIKNRYCGRCNRFHDDPDISNYYISESLKKPNFFRR